MSQITLYDQPKQGPTPIDVNVQLYNEQEQQETLEQMGQQASLFLYDEDPGNRLQLIVKRFKLNLTGFIPKLTVVLSDWTRTFADRLYRGDRRVVFFLDSMSLGTVDPWHMDFYVMSVDQNDFGTGDRETVLTCFIHTPQLMDFAQRALTGEGEQRKGQRRGITSWDASRQLAQEAGLGYASNTSSTNDRQVWLQPGIHRMEMLQHMLLHSWKGPESFMWGFLDRFYCYNYVDLEKCYSADFRADSMLRTNWGIRPEMGPPRNQEEAYPETPVVLTNGNAWKQTNHYVKVDVTDGGLTEQEALLSSHYGGNRFVNWYDIRGQWQDDVRQESRNSPRKQHSWAGSFNTELLDTVNYQSREEVRDKRLDFFRGNARISHGGRLDTYNAHDHYAWAKHHNAYNLAISSNMTLVCETGVLNSFLKRMQKVLCVFYSNPDMQGAAWDTELSGFWLISGMVLYGTGNSVTQRLYLTRRGGDFEEAKPEIDDFVNFYGRGNE